MLVTVSGTARKIFHGNLVLVMKKSKVQSEVGSKKAELMRKLDSRKTSVLNN